MRLYFKFQHFNSVHVVIFFKLEELRTFVADFLHDWKKFKNGPFPRNKVHIFDDSNQKINCWQKAKMQKRI